jgi:hypothetical protein
MIQKTLYAKVELARDEVLQKQISSLQDNARLHKAAQMTSESFVLLNQQRQVVFGNHAYLSMAKALGFTEIYGTRFGEHMGCIHAINWENSCGSAEACQKCGAINAVLKSLNGQVAMQRCSFPLQGHEDPLHLIIFTIPVRINNALYILAAFADDNKVIEQPHQLAEHTFAVQRLAARIEECHSPMLQH